MRPIQPPSAQGVGTTMITFLFTIAGLIASLWAFLSIPLGIIFGILYLTGKNDPGKAKFKKWALFSLAGIPVAIIIWILYSIYRQVVPPLGL